MSKPTKKLEWRIEATKRSHGKYCKYSIVKSEDSGLYCVLICTPSYRGPIATGIKSIEEAKNIAQDSYSKGFVQPTY